MLMNQKQTPKVKKKEHGTPTTEDDVTGAVTFQIIHQKKIDQQSQWMIQVNYQTVIHQAHQM